MIRHRARLPRTSAAARRRLTPEEKRAKARERYKRWYARQKPKDHEKVPHVPVDDEIVAMLIDLNWLDENDSEDRQKIGLAISSMLKSTAREHSRIFI
jgi:hypothetical protein